MILEATNLTQRPLFRYDQSNPKPSGGMHTYDDHSLGTRIQFDKNRESKRSLPKSDIMRLYICIAALVQGIILLALVITKKTVGLSSLVAAEQAQLTRVKSLVHTHSHEAFIIEPEKSKTVSAYTKRLVDDNDNVLIGQEFDVQLMHFTEESRTKWCKGRVIDVATTNINTHPLSEVLIHINGWTLEASEWLVSSSSRLAPSGTHTRSADTCYEPHANVFPSIRPTSRAYICSTLITEFCTSKWRSHPLLSTRDSFDCMNGHDPKLYPADYLLAQETVARETGMCPLPAELAMPPSRITHPTCGKVLSNAQMGTLSQHLGRPLGLEKYAYQQLAIHLESGTCPSPFISRWLPSPDQYTRCGSLLRAMCSQDSSCDNKEHLYDQRLLHSTFLGLQDERSDAEVSLAHTQNLIALRGLCPTASITTWLPTTGFFDVCAMHMHVLLLHESPTSSSNSYIHTQTQLWEAQAAIAEDRLCPHPAHFGYPLF